MDMVSEYTKALWVRFAVDALGITPDEALAMGDGLNPFPRPDFIDPRAEEAFEVPAQVGFTQRFFDPDGNFSLGLMLEALARQQGLSPSSLWTDAPLQDACADVTVKA